MALGKTQGECKMQIGCGRFTETDWMDYVLEPAAHPAVAQHLTTCARCRAEAQAIEKTGVLLQNVSKEHAAVREAFARSVVAEHLASQPDPSAAPSPFASLFERLRTPRFLSLAGAAAVCLAVALASFSGSLPWTGNTDAPLTSISLGHVAENESPQLMMAMESEFDHDTVELFMAPGPALFSAAASPPAVMSHVFASAVHEGADGSLEPEGIITQFRQGTTSFHTLTQLLLDEGSHDVHLTLLDPEGIWVASHHVSLVVHDASQAERIWIEWEGVALTEVGTYRLLVTVDGVETSFPVPVNPSL